MAQSAMAQSAAGSKLMDVVRAPSGNFPEMYDFMVFGCYTGAIGQAYFPGAGHDSFVSLMKALMVFGAGFSLAHSLATAAFGFTPAKAEWPIRATGNRAMPGAWVAAAAVLGLVASVLAGRCPAMLLRPARDLAA